jgi:hypothetical protein
MLALTFHCPTAADSVSVTALVAGRTAVTLRSGSADGTTSREVGVGGTTTLRVADQGCTWDVETRASTPN